MIIPIIEHWTTVDRAQTEIAVGVECAYRLSLHDSITVEEVLEIVGLTCGKRLNGVDDSGERA